MLNIQEGITGIGLPPFDHIEFSFMVVVKQSKQTKNNLNRRSTLDPSSSNKTYFSLILRFVKICSRPNSIFWYKKVVLDEPDYFVDETIQGNLRSIPIVKLDLD